MEKKNVWSLIEARPITAIVIVSLVCDAGIRIAKTICGKDK